MLNDSTINATATATNYNARQVKRIVQTACDVFTNQSVYEDWDYEDGTAVCYMKTAELPTIGLLQHETGARLAFCPISAEALTLIAPAWFVCLFLLRNGDFQREAERIDRDLIDAEDDFDFRGDVDQCVIENVFNDRDVKVCDVDRYPMAIEEDDREAKDGLKLIRSFGLDSYRWPYECAREVGKHCVEDWPDWAQHSFAIQVLQNAPTTAPQSFNMLRERDEQVCWAAKQQARNEIVSECAGIDPEEMSDRMLEIDLRFDELETEITETIRNEVCYA